MYDGPRDLPEVLDRIRRAVEANGVGLDADQEMATFEIEGQALHRRARWVAEGSSPSELMAEHDDPGEVTYLGDRITSALARWIRSVGGWYADASGNMHVRAPGVLVDIRGRPPIVSRQSSARANSRNLMSAGRAQVVFALLTWPRLLDSSMSEIGRVAGVSSSLAHTVVRMLQEQHYMSASSRRLDRRDELIDQWAAAYPLGLARSIELGRFVGEPRVDAWVDREYAVYVSGEYAAPQISGPDLVLYVPGLDARAVVMQRWRKPAPEEHANIILRETFWTDPEALKWSGVPRAPQLLVYGDLLASNDPRQRSIAAEMRGTL